MTITIVGYFSGVIDDSYVLRIYDVARKFKTSIIFSQFPYYRQRHKSINK